MSKGESKLDVYRALIRAEWLPLCGRKKLSSFEYLLTEEWHRDQVPIAWIVQAIKQVKARRRTVYSLGVIRGDLAAIQKEKAAARIAATEDAQDWRGRWDEQLEVLASHTTNPECASMARELKRDIPNIAGERELLARFVEITRCIDTSR